MRVRVRVQVSNAFYASLSLLKTAILVGFSHSHSFPLSYVRNYLFGHFLRSFLAIYWSCKVAQEGEGKPTSFVGLAPSAVRAELHPHSAVSLSSDTRLPLYPERLTTV